MATIFDILREADEDEAQTTQPAEDTNTIDVGDDTEDNAQEDNNDTVADDEFDIDTSLDDEGGDEDAPPDSDNNDSGDDSDIGGGNDEDEEPNEANTDIFSSLTAEEQQVKIRELKHQYNQLYMSCDKILERLNDIDPGDDGLIIINRFSSALYDLKVYISEYITNVFGTKSFVENDIMLNRFLSVIDSMTVILEKFNKSRERNEK